jgi:hypothetical protein
MVLKKGVRAYKHFKVEAEWTIITYGHVCDIISFTRRLVYLIRSIM